MTYQVRIYWEDTSRFTVNFDTESAWNAIERARNFLVGHPVGVGPIMRIEAVLMSQPSGKMAA